MINKTMIERNLRELNTRYNRPSRNPRDPLYYSQLALIEVCGWIELSMDTIIFECASRHLSDPGNLKLVRQEVIQKTYSFTYKNHFRPMLIRVVGLIKVEELEQSFNPSKFQGMKSSLGSLKQRRDEEAHTFIANITPNVWAPSMIHKHFLNVYDGLKDIEKCVRRLPP